MTEIYVLSLYVYECTLPQSERVSVQPGDTVGVEIARQLSIITVEATDQIESTTTDVPAGT